MTGQKDPAVTNMKPNNKNWVNPTTPKGEKKLGKLLGNTKFQKKERKKKKEQEKKKKHILRTQQKNHPHQKAIMFQTCKHPKKTRTKDP